jgi:hypothetical protein
MLPSTPLRLSLLLVVVGTSHSQSRLCRGQRTVALAGR